MDGSERKINAKGEFYGWAVNRYRQVEYRAPAGWLDGAKDWSVGKARALTPEEVVANAKGVDRQKLAKEYGWR